LRDLGEDLPACAWLVSPWTDLTLSGASLAAKDGVDPLIHRGYLSELAAAYVPGSMDRKDPPRFAALCPVERISSRSRSSGIGRNAAGRCHPLRLGCRRRRRGGYA
jgi:acetyl esterase/lipase